MNSCSIDISTVKIETIERHRTYTHTYTHAQIRQHNETEQQRENERNKKYHESGIFNAIAIQASTRNRSYGFW